MFCTTHKHLKLLSVERLYRNKQKKKNSNSTYSSPPFSGPQIYQRQFGHWMKPSQKGLIVSKLLLGSGKELRHIQSICKSGLPWPFQVWNTLFSSLTADTFLLALYTPYSFGSLGEKWLRRWQLASTLMTYILWLDWHNPRFKDNCHLHLYKTITKFLYRSPHWQMWGGI